MHLWPGGEIYSTVKFMGIYKHIYRYIQLYIYIYTLMPKVQLPNNRLDVENSNSNSKEEHYVKVSASCC